MAIVEGANSFITPEARGKLQDAGILIVKDASANKCGVITSSYEIMSGIMLDKDEFKAEKEELVKEIMIKLKSHAVGEAEWLFANYKAAICHMTGLTEVLSRRINEKNEIAPIEFNPLRFSGWSTTDITYFAFGFSTYDYYFNNKRPDWGKLLKGKDNKKYTLILLNKPSSYSDGDVFDFEMLKKDFTKILCLRELDYTKKENHFGFLFTETSYSNLAELTKITSSDLSQYIRC
jgi:hypothetical protein